MAVSFRPLGTQHQEAFVGCCRLFVSPAIAEDPGAQIRDVVAIGLQIKCGAGGLDRLTKALPVVQSRAQAAVKPGSFVVGEIATLKAKAAFLDLAGSGRAYRHLTNFTGVTQLGGTFDAAGGPRTHMRTVPAHHRPACLPGFTSR
jgi:hypothetical protein